MNSSFVYQKSAEDAPTDHEAKKWIRELEYLSVIPPNLRPPRSCLRYLLLKIKSAAKVPPNNRHLGEEQQWLVRPKMRHDVISAAQAIFLWFQEPAGFKYVCKLFGVEKVAPFAAGYTYYYVDPSLRPKMHLCSSDQKIKAALHPDNFQIYERSDSRTESFFSRNDTALAEELNDFLKQARFAGGATSADEFHPPEMGMYHWVSQLIYTWMMQRTPSDTTMEDLNRYAIAQSEKMLWGYQWVKKVRHTWPIKSHYPNLSAFHSALSDAQKGDIRDPNDLRYIPILKVGEFGERAYRIRIGNEVRWVGEESIVIENNIDALRRTGYSEERLVDIFRCSECKRLRPCSPLTEDNHLCAHCFSAHRESGDRPTKKHCERSECYACPNFAGNNHRTSFYQ